MNSTAVFQNNGLKLFSAIWAMVIFVPLIYFPSPAALVGHPWKVELVMSFVLGICLTGYLFTRQTNEYSFSFSPEIVRSIIAPCCALIILSALSAFWSGSVLSVLHHTLVWAGYLVFLLFAFQIVSDKKYFRIAAISLGSVVSIICLICILEFVFEEKIGSTFGYRYGRYAEIFAALLPLFFSFVLRLNRKHLVWAILVTSFLWFGLIFSLSRAALSSSVIGLSVFILLRIFTKKTLTEKRRLVFASLGIIFIALLIHISSSSSAEEQKVTAFSRFAIRELKDSSNSLSSNVRFLFAGVGLEMFSDNYLVGTGADNFGLEFNKYRAVFSVKPENKSIAELQQDFLPERAHNEYLQILAELGLVGGAIFLWLLGGILKLGFIEIKRNRFERADILTHAAVAGIVAFFCSSLFSSFSFRLMQNGLIFFFLLAILLRGYAIKKNQVTKAVILVPPHLMSALTAILLTACFSLTIFSALKATSQFFVYTAEGQRNFETAKFYYENAILLDPSNASANYSFGLRLLTENYHRESTAQLQQSLKKGINTPVCYSYLISSQTLANQLDQAVNTGSEAVRIFPYSVFLRVRYAALLKKFHQEDESQKQLEFAARLNKKQTETWWFLINNGALETSREARFNKEILSLAELNPEQAIYAVLTEREKIYPNEKTGFNF